METFRERTLANRYQPRQHLPPNFPSVLKEYAREVLRTQPEDVLQWSAAYFKRLALEADPMQTQTAATGDYAPAVEDPEHEILLQRILRAFSDMDKDNTGFLSVSAIKEGIVQTCGLTPTQVLYVMTSSPLVEQDTVEYKAFIRESDRAICFFQQTQHEFDVGDVEDATVHGLSQLDVKQEFLRFFRYVDEAETGFLSMEQYFHTLVNAPYHLTNRDLRLLRIEAVRNEKNEVEYEAELAHMFHRLLLAEQFSLFDEET